MPAENISAQIHPGTEPWQVRVQWGNDHDEIQVASGLNDEQQCAQRIIDIVNGWLEAAGHEPVPSREELQASITKRAKPDSLEAQFPIAFSGFFVNFYNRRQVNRMIAVLRKARDGAFGRDE